MPKFTNAVTGVTVSVDDDTAANLDPHIWESAKASDEKPTRRTSNK